MIYINKSKRWERVRQKNGGILGDLAITTLKHQEPAGILGKKKRKNIKNK